MANNITDELVARMSAQMMQHFANGDISLGHDFTDIVPKPAAVDAAPFAIPPEARPPSPLPSQLCVFCSKMRAEDLGADPGYWHVDDVRKLERSATSCAACNLIQLRIRRASMISRGDESLGESLTSALRSVQDDISAKGVLVAQPWRVLLRLSGGMAAFEKLVVKLYIPILKPIGGSQYQTGVFVHNFGHLCLHSQAPQQVVPLSPRGSEDQVLRRLSAWVEKSASEAALRVSLPSSMPTRVLDLGRDATWDADIKLIDSAGLSERYVTLSYCWGSYKDYRTLGDNLKDRKDRIAFSELPKMFAHAIKVTRALGVRYLWIDALCIIQDDKDDWKREASQMAQVYVNGYCRLAITFQKNPTEGFFPPDELYASVLLSDLKKSDLDGKSYPCYLSHPKHYFTDVDQGHLNTRAWVLQERVLAPRTIHFTKDHIYCEDQDDICGEDWVRRHYSWLSCIEKSSDCARSNLLPEERILRKAMDDVGGGREDPWLLRTFMAQDSYRHMNSGEHSWLQVMENFSQCQITYATDKCIAIAGLIDRKQTNPSSLYYNQASYLGLWERTLQMDLLWTKPLHGRLNYIEAVALPSWTWLAYNGPIKFVQDRRDPRDPATVAAKPVREFEVVHVNVPKPTDPLPYPDTAYLSLRLKLRQVSKISETTIHPSYKTLEEYKQVSPFSLHPGGNAVPLLLGNISDSHEMHDDAGTPIGFVAFDGDHSVTSNGALYCALIATLWEASSGISLAFATSIAYNKPGRATSNEVPRAPILAYGLLIQATGSSTNEYRRVGIVQVKHEWVAEGSTETICLEAVDVFKAIEYSPVAHQWNLVKAPGSCKTPNIYMNIGSIARA